MRRLVRVFALCLLLCAAFAVQAGAFDAAAQTAQDERTLRSAVSGDAQDYLAGTDGGDVTASFSRLFRNAASDAKRAWKSALGSMTAAAGIIILTALLRGFSHAAGGAADEAVDLAGVLGVSAVLLQDFSGVLSLCRAALDGIGVFSAALQPVLAAALSMGGNAVTATALQAATMLVFDLVLRLTESLLVPAVCVYLAVTVVDAAAGLSQADRELMQLFEGKHIPFVVAMNKADLVSVPERPCGRRRKSDRRGTQAHAHALHRLSRSGRRRFGQCGQTGAQNGEIRGFGGGSCGRRRDERRCGNRAFGRFAPAWLGRRVRHGLRHGHLPCALRPRRGVLPVL